MSMEPPIRSASTCTQLHRARATSPELSFDAAARSPTPRQSSRRRESRRPGDAVDAPPPRWPASRPQFPKPLWRYSDRTPGPRSSTCRDNRPWRAQPASPRHESAPCLRRASRGSTKMWWNVRVRHTPSGCGAAPGRRRGIVQRSSPDQALAMARADVPAETCRTAGVDGVWVRRRAAATSAG